MVTVGHADIHFTKRSHSNVVIGVPCCAEADHYADCALLAHNFGKLVRKDTVLHSDNERILLEIAEHLFSKACNSLELCCNDDNIKLFVLEFLERSVAVELYMVLALCSVEIKALFGDKVFNLIVIAKHGNVIAGLFHKHGKGAADCAGADK